MRIYSEFSIRPLEIKGCFSTSGEQLIDDTGGVPTCIAEVFKKIPSIKSIAIMGETSGIVYSLIKEESYANTSS